MKILLAIPAYRCEKQIVRVIEAIAKDAELRSLLGEILIVDNRSPDATVSSALSSVRAANLDDKISVVVNDDNYGLGGTHKAAFQYAQNNGYDFMAIVHGDDQADVRELKLLIRTAKLNPDAGAILGARFMPSSSLQGYSFLRIAGNVCFNLLYSIFLRRKIWDLGSGINLFKITAHPWSAIKNFSHQFTFNYDLILHYQSTKTRTIYVPITWREVDQSSNARNFTIARIALTTLLKYVLGQKLTSEPSREAYSFIRVRS